MDSQDLDELLGIPPLEIDLDHSTHPLKPLAKPHYWNTWRAWLKETMKAAYCSASAPDVMDDLDLNNMKHGLPIYDYVNQELVPEKRQILFTWMIEVTVELKLDFSTFFVAASILDQYCSRKSVLATDYQWVALTCLWTADKMNSVDPPYVFTYQELLAPGVCHDFAAMETKILQTLFYQLPTYTILSYFPLPFICNLPTQLSYRFMDEFQQFCHYICFVAINDFNIATLYRMEDIALCVFVIASENHYDHKYYVDHETLNREQTVLYERLKAKLFTLINDRSHSLTQLYNRKWNIFFGEYDRK